MNLLLAALIGGVFCSGWNAAPTPKDKVDFLLTRKPVVIEKMKQKGTPQGNIDIFTVCYDRNILKLKDILDRDCNVERELSKFFKQQVDTSNQEFDHITEYILMCTTTEGREL